MVKNLKNLRLKKGLSQQQLADILGISQQSVNKYENHNIEPDISTLSSMATLFNTSVDYLIGHSTIDHVIEKVEKYDLNDRESKLVDSYRKLSPREKESIDLVIENYISSKE